MMIPSVDQLTWIAMTVYMEAEGEPYEGKLAVAWSIVNRMISARYPRTAGKVVLQKWQYSAWNVDSPTRGKLDDLGDTNKAWWDSYRAAAAAYFDLSPDPTQGGTHYLNEAVVKSVTGKLPSWFDASKVTKRIGLHTFLRGV